MKYKYLAEVAAKKELAINDLMVRLDLILLRDVPRIYDALLTLKDYPSQTRYDVGICGNVEMLNPYIDSSDEILSLTFKALGLGTIFPVEDFIYEDKVIAEEVYHNTDNKWNRSTKQGIVRWELLSLIVEVWGSVITKLESE